jgi:hypothetical protein
MASYLPNAKERILLLIVITPAPAASKPALIRVAVDLPEMLMALFAMRLPTRPPTVKTEVTIENVKSDIRIDSDTTVWI